MRLRHIDNNFYYLTPRQAKSLCVENVLPKHGYERKANFEKLKDVELVYRTYSVALSKQHYKQAWISRTPLSYWDGKKVEQGFVWAIHLHQ
jgi:hypothetical protein